MDTLFSAREMSGLPPVDIAKRAIRHTLERIHDTPEVAYYCGLGTGTFSKLTEALAVLADEPDLAKIRKSWVPKVCAPVPAWKAACEAIAGMVDSCVSGSGKCESYERERCPVCTAREALKGNSP